MKTISIWSVELNNEKRFIYKRTLELNNDSQQMTGSQNVSDVQAQTAEERKGLVGGEGGGGGVIWTSRSGRFLFEKHGLSHLCLS